MSNPDITLSTSELIDSMARCRHIYFHTSLSPITKLVDWNQPLISDYNCGGRPAGMYVSKGEGWLDLISSKLRINLMFKQYATVYAVDFNKSNIIEILSLDDLRKFDNIIPDYWINPNFNTGCYTSMQKYRSPIHTVPIPEIVESSNSLAEGLLSHKVIFDTREPWLEACKTAGLTDPMKANLWRLKRWDIVAKKAKGIIFDKFYTSYKEMWYKSLSVQCACIWDVTAYKDIGMVAHVIKKGRKTDENPNILDHQWEITDLGKTLFGFM